MIKNLIIFLLAVVICSVQRGYAEDQNQKIDSEPIANQDIKLKKKVTRTRLGLNEPPTLGSSFVGELDNLDPMLPNRDNLKEDEEPVLDTIRTIADAEPESAPVPEVKEPVVQVDNSPDLELEKKFHKWYKLYHSKPTPNDIWKAAASKQQAHEYLVQKGDTLWSISKLLFGDANFWPKLWSLNKQGILNPHFIRPKTKVYFYSGDQSQPPSLAVGESNSDSTNGVVSSNGESSEKKVNDNEVQPVQQPDPNYGTIPDSLPIHRNADYFLEAKKDSFRMDLGQSPIPNYEIAAEIFITDVPLKTDVKIQLIETSKMRCYDGRVVKAIEYLDRLIEDYDIYKLVDSFRTTIGTMHAYSRFGRAKIYNGNYLKIFNCTGIISTDLVIIPKEKMNIHRNRKLSVTKMARIVGGPDQKDQNFFVNNQIAYVDFGRTSYSAGQEYKTISKVTDEINGQFKVLYKYGSFAVVLITEVNDMLEVGDKVILN